MCRKAPVIVAGLCFSGLLLACSDQGVSNTPEGFTIHMHEVGYFEWISSNDSLEMDEIDLQAPPVITLDDIRWYDWDQQTINLTERASERLSGRMWGEPFVVSVKGERIYEGTITAAYSSMLFSGITLDIAFLQHETVTWLQYNDFGGDEDLRADPRILQALLSAGKLR